MAKYHRLTSYLEGLTTTSRRVGFAEIENILKFSLPKSARRYTAWWANNLIKGRQSIAWLSAGWETEDLDLGGEAVTFRRADTIKVKKALIHASAQPTPAPKTDLDFDQLQDAVNGSIAIQVAMQWKQLGIVTLDKIGKLSFPAAPTVAALYRIRLMNTKGTRHYIGEAVNLRRRFGNYRNPGPTQATSLRINALLREHIKAGGRVVTDLIASGIRLSVGSKSLKVNLSEKAVRRLLEQAAVIANVAIDIDSLNR